MWDGYSLLYIEGNEKSHHQDLGSIQSYYKLGGANHFHRKQTDNCTTLFFRCCWFLCGKVQHDALHVL